MLPKIFASDFDGVICDGLIEYFASTEKAYRQIWSQQELIVNEELKSNFYRLRPVIETGWEMPVLLRALTLQYSPEKILTQWHLVRDEIVSQEKLDKKYCAQALDKVRDNYIKNDLDQWLSLHRFYPNVIERLKRIVNSNIQFYIITTKEGRFVKQLLQQQGIELPEERIIGKESKRPKYETLRIIKNNTGESNENIWFIEDRLQALKQVKQQQDLTEIQLFLADWGYNTETEKASIKNDSKITLLSLSQFAQNFSNWQ